MRRTIAAMVYSLALLGPGLDGSRIHAQESPKGEKRYAPTPWHLVDIWWDLGEDTPFQSYSIDVTIDRDIPTSTSLYIAPLGLGQFGETSFYGGIQTRTDGNTKKDRELRQLGPGFLFSMWGERGYDAIRPSAGGFCQSSGHEGDFVSVRCPFQWSKGTYTYRISRMDEEEVNGRQCTWVGAFVYSHEKDENVFVGALRFPSKDLVLSRKVASFVEIYGQRIPVAEIPQATLTFGKLRVNGKAVRVASAEAVYPDGVPDYADTQAREDRLIVTLGKPIENRTARSVRLIPADTRKP
ncbi:DUF3472 domain-containing protein [Singulisphaera sp. PoT]|uniref:DUF3472 domain-containing protein n=1 Tax=Singulisphaera sp. PoT TaxID=3411797 RepID=UPI003BF467E4